MRTRGTLLLAGLAATCLIAVAVQAAQANRIGFNEGRFRTATSALHLGLLEGGPSINCAVTLEGSFHSTTISKVSEALIGLVLRASAGACSGGALTFLTETLPWHLAYRGFSGVLPNFGGIEIDIVGLSMQINFEGLICLARSTAARPAGVRFRQEGGGRTLALPQEPIGLPVTEMGCEMFTLIYGEFGAVTRSGTTNQFRLTLV